MIICQKMLLQREDSSGIREKILSVAPASPDCLKSLSQSVPTIHIPRTNISINATKFDEQGLLGNVIYGKHIVVIIKA